MAQVHADVEAGSKCQRAIKETYSCIAEAVEHNDIKPDEALGPDLLPGETILKQFDVFFPVGRIPVWLFWFLTCTSFGIFYCVYYITQWCYEKKCCVPKTIEMVRGRMVVTSSGRLLVWHTEVVQERLGGGTSFLCLCKLLCKCARYYCAPPVKYSTRTKTVAYTIAQIRDVELFTAKQMPFLLGCCCCAETYDAAVRVNFSTFSEDAAETRCFETGPAARYSERVRSFFSLGQMIESAGIFGNAKALLGSLVGVNMSYVDIVASKRSDTDRDYEHPTCKDAYESLADINREICAWSLQGRAPVWQEAPEAGAVLPDATKPYAYGDLDVVSEDACRAPSELVALAPGEKFLACASNMYIITLFDKIMFVLYVVTFPFTFPWGITYILKLRMKRAHRTGVILTTHRLVKIEVSRDDSCWSMCCPSALMCLFPTKKALSVRSLIPGYVRNGIISRVSKQTVTGEVLTDAGAIRLTFDVKLGVLGPDEVLTGESRMLKRINLLKIVSSPANRGTVTLDPGAVRKIVTDDDTKAEPTEELSKIEKQVLPLLDGEVVLARYVGKIYENLGPEGSLCSNDCTMYPGIALACYCGFRPLFNSATIVLTNKSVYAFNESSNAPWCFADCLKKQNFEIFWAPISDVVGSECDTTLAGRDAFWPRLCFGTFCGNNCCPRMRSTLSLSLGVASIHECFPIQCADQNLVASIRKDPKVTRYRKLVAAILAQLQATASALPAAAALSPGKQEQQAAPVVAIQPDASEV